MSKYRILEKEGQWIYPEIKNHNGKSIIKNGNVRKYIPRFILQEDVSELNIKMYLCGYCGPALKDYNDLQEFTSLEEARKFKRSLELKKGIVRE